MEKERKRVLAEIEALTKKGVDNDFIRTTLSSDILSRQELEELMDDFNRRKEREAADRKITPRTIRRSFLGIVLASLAGGIVCAVIQWWMKGELQAGGLVLTGLFFGCYFIIRSCTGGSARNIIVVPATLISTVLSLWLCDPLLWWVISMFYR